MINTEALRNKILDLATQGKLTEQLPEDGNAEDLYAQIQEEKSEILKVRNGRTDKQIKETSNDTPFDIPSSWKWIRFGEIGLFKKGPFGSALTKSMFVPKGADTIKVYEQQHAIQKDSNLGTYYITREYFENKMTAFEVLPGDILVSCAGTIGETFILPEEIETGIINQALMRITLTPSIDKRFFQYYFDANLKSSAQSESNGMAITNIPPFDVLKNWYFPLPPKAEQKRIVNKISVLFELIDKIEELQAKYADDVEVLKNKIIDAGIQGKLTKQLPEDGNAEDLLKKIDMSKEKLEKTGTLKGRKKKDIRNIKVSEYPFEIPDNWKWVRLGRLLEVFGRIGFRGYTKEDIVNVGEGAMSLSPSNITEDGEMTYNDCTYVSWEKYNESPEIMIEEGDVLIVKTGSSYGKCSIVGEMKHPATINPQLAVLKYILCDKKYVKYALNSSMAKAQYETFVVGAATPTFSQEKLSNLLVPLPPLAEQKRIAETIEKTLKELN